MYKIRKMHGRLKVKTSKEQEEEQKIREREKAYNFRRLTKELFDLRPNTAENYEEIFKLTTQLLLINPDFYTAWNIRREALLTHVEESTWKDELAFTIDCLRKNEKSYSVWQHRVWILSKMPKSEYESEILLCNSFLTKDERNFHCWNYRSHICDIAQTDLKKEFDFTTSKIHSNFSNFSAWHRRHKLLLKGLAMPEDECPEASNLRIIWPEEYNMALNAIFTDPSDQSPWLYHNWLVKNNFGHLGQDQMDKLVALQELEPSNRWVKQALALVREYIHGKESSRPGNLD